MYFIRKYHPQFVQQQKPRAERSFDEIIRGVE
jgi:hypothetical protein